MLVMARSREGPAHVEAILCESPCVTERQLLFPADLSLRAGQVTEMSAVRRLQEGQECRMTKSRTGAGGRGRRRQPTCTPAARPASRRKTQSKQGGRFPPCKAVRSEARPPRGFLAGISVFLGVTGIKGQHRFVSPWREPCPCTCDAYITHGGRSPETGLLPKMTP